MEITSTSFEPGGKIPKEFTADGKDVNPPLKFSKIPENTKSFAIIVDDPDAPSGTWVHWVCWNIPFEKTEIEEASKIGNHGVNDFRSLGYGGPSPPPGPSHTYRFKLYALDSMLSLGDGASKSELEAAMQGHILEMAQLQGEYQR